LSFLARRLGKTVRGASDNFDLTSPTGEMMMQFFGMFARFFIAKVREQVRRGMAGAARRGTSVGRPPLGYGLVPVVGPDGRPAADADGRVRRRKVIHPETMQYVLLAVDMLVRQSRTPGEIAIEFNRLKVDGSDG